jgi:hypothetical protein
VTSSSSNTPQRITFGVELETLIPYLFPNQPVPAKDDDREVIRLPDGDIGEPRGHAGRAADILQMFLENHGVAMFPVAPVQAASPTKTWSLGLDSTVEETEFRARKNPVMGNTH